MPSLLAKSISLILVAVLLNGCRVHHGDSSASVKHARSRSAFIAEYAIPANADLGEYRLIEVWVEKSKYGDQEIVVRLKGLHHGSGAFRVRIAGVDAREWRGVWSERYGPPYERWKAPNPLPDTLRIERDDKFVEVHRKYE